jgi:hypothetical protein
MALVGAAMRLTSSHSFQPTSPAQISPVPGRSVSRNGLRNPYATIRRAIGSALAALGLSGSAAPVSGSMRRIVPSPPVGSATVRTSWLRSAPPSAPGGLLPGSPHGLTGVPSWP